MELGQYVAQTPVAAPSIAFLIRIAAAQTARRRYRVKVRRNAQVVVLPWAKMYRTRHSMATPQQLTVVLSLPWERQVRARRRYLCSALMRICINLDGDPEFIWLAPWE